MGSASSKTRKDKAKSSTIAACPTDTAAAKACPTRLDDGLAQVAMFAGLRQVTMGVLRIDYDYQTNLGDILDPRSFDFRLVSATVEGLTFKRAQEGEPLPCYVMSNLDGAVKKLIDAGADFIVGDCGFLVYWQVYVRDFAQQYAGGRACPVMLSSLVLSLPLLATIPVGGKIGILTASKGSLMKMQKKLASVIELQKEEARTRAVPAAVQPSGIEINFSDPRFKVVGLDTVNSFKTALADDSGVDDRRSIAIEIAKYCKQVACDDPAICAWLIECTEAGGFSWAIKLGTGLPVWDPVTIGRFLSLGFTSSLPSVALTLGETGQVALDPNETDVSKGRPTKAEHRFGPEFEEMLQ